MADYATTIPVPDVTPIQMAPLPGWAAPAPGGAPDYDQLLAQARMKMMDMPAPAQRPTQPSPSSWSEAGIFGAGQPSASSNDERLRNLPPGIRRVLERLPQDQQDRLLGMWGDRAGAGFTDRQQGEGGGGGRGFAAGQGRQADGSMAGTGNGEPPSSAGSGFGSFGFGSQPLGKGWRAGTALTSAINPFAGLLAEGGRRASNVSYANSQRNIAGIEPGGFWGNIRDSFGAGGSGSDTRSIGKVDIGGRSTDVSYGGILDSGRTSYTPEEAQGRQWAQDFADVDRGGGGGGVSSGYGGGGDDFDPSGRW